MKAEKQEYKGRKIELRQVEGERILLLDNERLSYGQLEDGKYFLRDYAYDWTDDLTELARRYVDHLEKVKKARTANTARTQKGRS